MDMDLYRRKYLLSLVQVQSPVMRVVLKLIEPSEGKLVL